MNDIPKLFMILGAMLILIGVLMKSGLPLGRLPGDIVIQKESFSFYFPITTCILASIVISLIVRLLR